MLKDDGRAVVLLGDLAIDGLVCEEAAVAYKGGLATSTCANGGLITHARHWFPQA